MNEKKIERKTMTTNDIVTELTSAMFSYYTDALL